MMVRTVCCTFTIPKNVNFAKSQPIFLLGESKFTVLDDLHLVGDEGEHVERVLHIREAVGRQWERTTATQLVEVADDAAILRQEDDVTSELAKSVEFALRHL